MKAEVKRDAVEPGDKSPRVDVDKSRYVSFSRSLLRSLSLLVLLLFAAILGISMDGTRRAVRTLCEDLVVSGVDRLETELHRFFGPIPSFLFIAQDWSEQGLLDQRNPDRMNLLFAPYIEESPQVSSINVATGSGASYMLLLDAGEGEWLSRYTNPAETGASVRWKKWRGRGEVPQEWTEELGFDPVVRPWYQIAAAEGASDSEVFWTEPYTFFATGEPGITASVRIRDPEGRLSVLAADILLTDISKLTASFEISPRGFAVVTDANKRVVGLPRDPAFTTPEQVNAACLNYPSELGIPLIAAAAKQILDHFGIDEAGELSVEYGLANENRPFRWEHEGMKWWTYIRPCRIENGPLLWMGVAIPEDDFLSELKRQRLHYLWLAAAALIVAAIIAIQLARRYSRPIQDLIAQSDRLRTLNTEKVETAASGIREIAQLNDSHERMRLALDSFARYVPSEVVRELLEKGEAAVIGGRNAAMSILFTDIEGFTPIAEAMTPGDLTKHMASYFEAMIAAIADHSGTVDKLIGDAIVAFWGAPKPSASHARDAARSALACSELLQALNREWEQQGLPRLPTRFGISTGEVVVGNVGAPRRLSYTALGDAVNLASRLEGANVFYGTRILVSAATVSQAGDEFVWRRLDRVRVKGRLEPEMIFEMLGRKGRVPENTLAWAEAYENALDAYFQRRFRDAIASLEGIESLKIDRPGDKSIGRLAALCQSYCDNPPAEGWDGVSQFASKF